MPIVVLVVFQLSHPAFCTQANTFVICYELEVGFLLKK